MTGVESDFASLFLGSGRGGVIPGVIGLKLILFYLVSVTFFFGGEGWWGLG